MLHSETVEPDTLSLIYSVQSKPYTNDFVLVGGTALALQIGHRTSTDIDLFTIKKFEVEELLTHIQQDYTIFIRNRMNHALLVDVNSIKTDFVFQPSKQIDSWVELEGIRMASIREIAAMKISAITARGKKRDFVDLFCLLKHYSLQEILNAFLEKYTDSTLETAIRSLFYFEDAESDFEPRCFFDYKWGEVKETIRLEASKL